MSLTKIVCRTPLLDLTRLQEPLPQLRKVQLRHKGLSPTFSQSARVSLLLFLSSSWQNQHGDVRTSNKIVAVSHPVPLRFRRPVVLNSAFITLSLGQFRKYIASECTDHCDSGSCALIDSKLEKPLCIRNSSSQRIDSVSAHHDERAKAGGDLDWLTRIRIQSGTIQPDRSHLVEQSRTKRAGHLLRVATERLL